MRGSLWPANARTAINSSCGHSRRSSATAILVRHAARQLAREREWPANDLLLKAPDSAPRIVPATANDDERLWSIAEVAHYLGVSKDTIYGWRKSGYGPAASKVGKHLRWRPVDVTDWIDRLRQIEPSAFE